MKLNLAVRSNRQNQNYKIKQRQTSFTGGAQSFAVKSGYKAKIPFDKISGLATAIVSTIGFGVGGLGLFTDSFKKKKKVPEYKYQTAINTKEKNTFKNFKQTRDIRSLSVPEQSSDKEGEFGNIQPKTQFGKIGLGFAKVGIMFSGIAGFFNGIAMRIPLMAAGESVNVISSPIINTPTGFGLFNIGLAAIFAGRALENDPSLKMNPAILNSKKTFGDKSKYILDNMKNSMKEVVKSTKEVGGNFVNLFKNETKDAAKVFFRDNVVAIKPSTVTFSQKLLANGEKVVEAGLKSPPHRMHSASLLLAAGGLLLTTFGLLKKAKIVENEAGVKTSFKIAEAGGMLDNIGLAYMGMEKMSMGQKAAGLPLAISGFTILSGTPQAEKDYGRGLQWIGTCALFLVFALERGIELKEAKVLANRIKNSGMTEEASELIRQWEVSLPKGFGNKEILKPYLSDLKDVVGLNASDSVGMGGLFKRFVKNAKTAIKEGKSIKEVAKEADEHALKEKARERMLADDAPKEIKEAVRLVDEIKLFLAEGKFKQGREEAQSALRTHLKKKGFDSKLVEEVKLMTEGKQGEIAKSVIGQNVNKFGNNYKAKLQQIANDSSIHDDIKKEAQQALSKMVS